VSSPREQFLERVRQAVINGNQVGGSPALPDRNQIGYQGSGADPIARLRDELTAAGGMFHHAPNNQTATALITQLVRDRSARRVLLGEGPFLSRLDLDTTLRQSGVDVFLVSQLDSASERPAFFNADVGISGVEHVIAETGTVVLNTRRDQPRALSLLPPVHLAVAHVSQIIPDLFDLFVNELKGGMMPACVSLITGPSKTGDIELKLVTGVHGPGELHLILVS
jgi:L-lactate utilization protein LutC